MSSKKMLVRKKCSAGAERPLHGLCCKRSRFKNMNQKVK